MKIYPEIDVELTYQNFGSAWLGVLRGSTDNIETVFNGLFNLCATNGERQFQDHLQCVAVFWSDRRAMRRFFFNRYYMPRYHPEPDVRNVRLVRDAMRYALQSLKQLAQGNHEAFLDFSKCYVPEVYGTGTISAERPDSDMKDAILSHAFAEKDSAKVVDSPVTA
jgi:hypothetical protein